MTEISDIQRELESYSTEEKRVILPRFFKTGQGEYGEGDQFLGVTVPCIRMVAKKHLNLSRASHFELLASPWHEVRMCSLLIWCAVYEKADDTGQTEIYRDYLEHTQTINNWDLVDLSAPKIVGAYLKGRKEERKILYQLAKSNNLWKQRIAVVSTYTLIRNHDFGDILQLSEQLLHHPHDLMQKAIGWMLREVGKRDKEVLFAFLHRYSAEMPRTMLRYAIEKFDEETRQYFLKKK